MAHSPSFRGLRKGFIGLGAAAVLCSAVPARADAPVIIRDTEIEKDIKGWVEPVMRAGGLDPNNVHIIIVESPEVNSFVAGGPNIFIYTGLIEKTDNASEIIGVLAHEMGHIRGGHLIRMQGAMKDASYESLLGTILGIGAAIASHNGGAAGAISIGSQTSAMGSLLAFSRIQEASADQSALTTLQEACISPKGLVSFMKKIGADEPLLYSQQDAWGRTHPLTQERVDAMQAGYDRSPCKDKPLSAETDDQYRRMMAKLKAFIAPERVAWDFSDSDHSVPAAYARAIAAYRQNKVHDALRDIDALLEREPKNPYFLELKGQMLVDFGHVEEALPAYRQSIDILHNAPLIRMAYANAMIETSDRDKGRLDEAIKQLETAQRDEQRSGYIDHLLATAWGRKGNESMAKLYLAEEALLGGQKKYAKEQAQAALHGLKAGTQPYLRAQDIISFVDQNKKDGSKDGEKKG
ncbi:MAG TPA: M48 family metalloprotease [Patescibacteria group bacterium]|nr:M48 family metalloprotease [Patescibacteria group bacterium]